MPLRANLKHLYGTDPHTVRAGVLREALHRPTGEAVDYTDRASLVLGYLAEYLSGRPLHHLVGIADDRALNLHHGDEEREQHVLRRHGQAPRHHAVFHAVILRSPPARTLRPDARPPTTTGVPRHEASTQNCVDAAVRFGTPERVWASVAALVALGGVVIGWLALARSRRTELSG
ncbi:DUF6223 family protein [Streptosporangium canum]|uniref:DUF6223 family protein n=1 Tax=Streptosporangium canum TaxID=324952 RepID=UPI003679CA6F